MESCEDSGGKVVMVLSYFRGQCPDRHVVFAVLKWSFGAVFLSRGQCQLGYVVFANGVANEVATEKATEMATKM